MRTSPTIQIKFSERNVQKPVSLQLKFWFSMIKNETFATLFKLYDNDDLNVFEMSYEGLRFLSSIASTSPTLLRDQMDQDLKAQLTRQCSNVQWNCTWLILSWMICPCVCVHARAMWRGNSRSRESTVLNNYSYRDSVYLLKKNTWQVGTDGCGHMRVLWTNCACLRRAEGGFLSNSIPGSLNEPIIGDVGGKISFFHCSIAGDVCVFAPLGDAGIGECGARWTEPNGIIVGVTITDVPLGSYGQV